MSYDELKDWLYRIRSEIITFMPKIWHKKMIETIDEAIAAVNRQQKLDDIMQPFQAMNQEELDDEIYNNLTIEEIRCNLQEFNGIIREIKEILSKGRKKKND